MRHRRFSAALAGAVLFALNVWICHRLFSVEFTSFQSNESAFISISRFFLLHWRDLRWFPWFNAGMPIENAYQPVLPLLTAVLTGASGLTVGRAFHVVLAMAYCLGPVTLFWFAWDWSESLATGFLAGLLYSLISPAAMLFPAVRGTSGGVWSAQRLFNLVWFGEDPHIVALTLLPVALLFLRRAIVRRDRWSLIGAVFSCSAVVLTNAFGALTLGLGAVCIVLALRRGSLIVSGVGVAAWFLSAPWVPPSLIATIRQNAFSARGQYAGTLRTYVAVGIVLLIFGALWVATRQLKSTFERFVWLFAPWMCAFPVLYYAADITLVPQSHRYMLELELAVCMLLAVVLVRVMMISPAWRLGVSAALLILMIHQAWHYRNFAHSLIKPVEVNQTLEYKVARWIDRNLPGQRVMVSGDTEWLFNVFSENPQMSAGHEPTALNFIQQIAVYQMCSGDGAGNRDAEISILWLKAFGNRAVTVPGTATREVYQPFANATKFEGILPVLFRLDGDTIYKVPGRSASLAHIVPPEALVKRRPVNGMDVDGLRTYVAALDNTDLQLADLTWSGPSKGRVHGRIARGQMLSIQVNYDPAWQVRVAGVARRVMPDGLGLMAVDPGCDGDCVVDLEYGTTPQIWICRVLSSLAFLGMIAVWLKRP